MNDNPEGQRVPVPKRSAVGELTTVPNLLTILRVLLIPPVMWLMSQETRATALAAAIVFAIAALTDWADGVIARRRNLVTVMGKLLDPVADKLLVMSILIVATALGRIPAWFVVLLLAREFVIQGMRTIVGQAGKMIEVVSAGKLKTAFQLVGLACIVLYYSDEPYEIGVLEIPFGTIGFGFLAVSLFFSYLSAAIYTRRFVSAMFGSD